MHWFLSRQKASLFAEKDYIFYPDFAEDFTKFIDVTSTYSLSSVMSEQAVARP